MRNKLYWIVMLIVVIVAALLRLYKLDKIPPALNWDEVAAGYNAYTIAHWAKDEWGKTLPLVFTSFRDDKHPVHIYLTAPIVGLFGLTDYTTRLSSALIGILMVIVAGLLARLMFNNWVSGLSAAILMGLSPYALHYSRGLWEANFALFFFILGLLFFFYGKQKKNYFLMVSFFSFGLSLIAYHSSKIVVFPLVILLNFIYFRELVGLGKKYISGLVLFTIFIGLIIINPKLLGLERAKQTRLSEKNIISTYVYRQTKSELLGISEVVFTNYIRYFTPGYLFKYGDQNPRGSIKVAGEFFILDALLVPFGIIFFLKKKKKEIVFLLTWLFLAPLPGAFSSSTPHSTRAIFMLGAVVMLSSGGAEAIGKMFKNKIVALVVLLSVFIFIIVQATHNNRYYFTQYAQKDAIEWQYGMKEVVQFMSLHPEFQQVYIDKIRQQPYIFFLFYLKIPLSEFLKSVKYDTTEARSYNTVASFGRYNFGNWNPIESYPYSQVSYVITPSYFGGLHYLSSFRVSKLVKYPNDSDAFYIINGYE